MLEAVQEDGELRFDPSVAGPKGVRIGPALHFPILAEGLDLALHYGWFAEPAAVADSLEALRLGQAAFTREVVELVSPSATRVLDVGTGRGETARALAERGADVVTLSPDPNQGMWLARSPHPRITFVRTRFEDYAPSVSETRFSHVVFSESSNYVALDNLLTHSAHLTTPDGALLIAAPFLRGESSSVYQDMHPLAEFRRRLARSCWRIRAEHDFTKNVAPTLRIGQSLVRQHVAPSVRALDQYLTAQGPLPLRLLGLLLRPYRKRGLKLLEQDLPALLDEHVFSQDVAFLFLRLGKETS